MRFLQTFGRVVPLIGLIVLPAVSAQAGLFDFFSSAPPEPQTMTIEQSTPSTLPPLVSPLPPHRVEIHRHITVVHKNSSDKTPVFDHQSFGLKKDATLREGDAVMTRSGIRIFAGTSSGEHQTDEFAKLEEAKGLSPAEADGF